MNDDMKSAAKKVGYATAEFLFGTSVVAVAGVGLLFVTVSSMLFWMGNIVLKKSREGEEEGLTLIDPINLIKSVVGIGKGSDDSLNHVASPSGGGSDAPSSPCPRDQDLDSGDGDNDEPQTIGDLIRQQMAEASNTTSSDKSTG